MKYLPLFLCLALGACNKPADEASSAPKLSLEPYFTAIAPPSPKSIHELRASAKPGDLVSLTGVVMGREEPFVNGRAAFVLADPDKVTACNKMAMDKDSCKTPWDACCDSPEVKKAGSVTVQILGADGRVLKQGIKGEHGLKELSHVSLTGTVDKTSTADVMVINATALHVMQ
jgi:hypothetical protein